ncbi:MAG TPA: four helix bundle protein [Gemmatimonadales bacterium]|nr:four helix bundle protein [Gemmatimonadales bacterium]
MTGARRIEDLRCWQEARALAIDLEALLQASPAVHSFHADQLRRAAISVSNNIAEGFARFTASEFHRFLRIARASCIEISSLLTTGKDLAVLDPEKSGQASLQCEKVTALVTRLMRHLRDSGRRKK